MADELTPGQIVQLKPECRQSHDHRLRHALGFVTRSPNELGTNSWVRWVYSDGENAGSHGVSLSPHHVTPVAVINPLDPEHLKRLYHSSPIFDMATHHAADMLGEAILNYADPEKVYVDEPKGLGAVVRLRDGRKLVANWVNSKGQLRWYGQHAPDSPTFAHYWWSELDVVEVLSPGYVE